ncbi:MAG: hypothetical protein KGJ40_04290 [candidate division NC10 bacterium]|nr:hypothetical protein [candidate division NC10 bacterium]MDE2485715.1 hypothetical protein [candidate division NC10 bacterium]
MSRRRPTFGEYNAMGVYLNSRGAYDLAIGELKKARQIAPLSPFVHYNLAAACFEKRDLDQAFSAVQAALDLQPYYIKARLLLGLILKTKGLFEESRRELTWVVEQDPSGRSGRDAREALVDLESKMARRHGGPQ